MGRGKVAVRGVDRDHHARGDRSADSAADSVEVDPQRGFRAGYSAAVIPQWGISAAGSRSDRVQGSRDTRRGATNPSPRQGEIAEAEEREADGEEAVRHACDAAGWGTSRPTPM